MAQQEGGWPLGLQPLNVRVGLIRNLDFSGSLSFNTLTSGSPTCSSITSSDLDSESTGSFFHERSITLGSLIGVTSNILELSSRSLRSRRRCGAAKEKKSCKTSRACFSLCPRAQLGNTSDAAGNAPSLGHFLEVERRACNAQRNQGSITYEIEGLPEYRSGSQTPNSLFSNGLIAPPRCVHSSDTDGTNRGIGHENGYWFPLIFPCMR